MSRATAPEVGVVIANYNNAPYVEHAIESVARQTLQNIRIVVVDDASTDGSDLAIRRVLDRIDDRRFQYIALDANLGQSGAIRRGLQELTAPFVCFLDSDDFWFEDFASRHLATHLNADFPVALTYSDSHIVDAAGCILAGTAWWFDHSMNEPNDRFLDPVRIPAISPEEGRVSYSDRPALTLHTGWQLDWASNSTSGMMVRRSFVDLVLLPPDRDLALYVDFYLSTCAALLTGTIALHDALYAYRMHGTNKHSDGVVLGGAYNSSTKPWGPIRDSVLRRIVRILESEADALRTAFGKYRYDLALGQLRSALKANPADRSSKNRSKLQGFFWGDRQ
jgi:glycosyltransferase involved in cell wall biosynthesis